MRRVLLSALSTAFCCGVTTQGTDVSKILKVSKISKAKNLERTDRGEEPAEAAESLVLLRAFDTSSGKQNSNDWIRRSSPLQ